MPPRRLFWGAPVLRSVGYCVASGNISSCTLPITNRSVAVSATLSHPLVLWDSTGFSVAYFLLYLLPVAFSFFFFLWFFALWLLSLYVGMQKDLKNYPWHDDHHLPRIPIGELVKYPPVAMNFKDSPPHLLLAFELRGWVTWRWGGEDFSGVIHSCPHSTWFELGATAFLWSITREPIEPLVLIASRLCSSLDFPQVISYFFLWVFNSAPSPPIACENIAMVIYSGM